MTDNQRKSRLEYVLVRARLVWGETAAQTWLESANVHLGGGRPIDVLQLSGPAPVLEALDAETWGGDRGYRDVSSPEAKARIWQEAHEHATRDYPKLLERARNHTTPKDHA